MAICPSKKKGDFSTMFIALAKGDLDKALGDFGKAKWPIVRELANEREVSKFQQKKGV